MPFFEPVVVNRIYGLLRVHIEIGCGFFAAPHLYDYFIYTYSLSVFIHFVSTEDYFNSKGSLETNPRTEAITEDHKFIAADFIVINKIEGGDVYERVFI